MPVLIERCNAFVTCFIPMLSVGESEGTDCPFLFRPPGTPRKSLRRSISPTRHESPSAAGTRFATRQYIICSSPATLLLLPHHFWRLQIRNVALFHTTLLHPACTASSWCRDSSCELTFATFREDPSQLSTRFYFPSPGLLRRPATVFDPRTVAELFL